MVDYRNRRVSDEIKKIIGDILIKDVPSNKFGLVTVTNVRCTPDLMEAKVYLSIYNKDPELKAKGIQRIKKKASYIRGLLGNRLSLKYVPKLLFFEDGSQEYAENIERLIQSLHNEDKTEQ